MKKTTALTVAALLALSTQMNNAKAADLELTIADGNGTIETSFGTCDAARCSFPGLPEDMSFTIHSLNPNSGYTVGSKTGFLEGVNNFPYTFQVTGSMEAGVDFDLSNYLVRLVTNQGGRYVTSKGVCSSDCEYEPTEGEPFVIDIENSDPNRRHLETIIGPFIDEKEDLPITYVNMSGTVQATYADNEMNYKIQSFGPGYITGPGIDTRNQNPHTIPMTADDTLRLQLHYNPEDIEQVIPQGCTSFVTEGSGEDQVSYCDITAAGLHNSTQNVSINFKKPFDWNIFLPTIINGGKNNQ